MKVNNIFKSIQGEGKYTGYPALFIRLSGCNRNCSFCDTKYHKENFDMSIDKVVKKIKETNKHFIVWTGGEPLLQYDKIKKVIDKTYKYYHLLETNGDFLDTEHLKNFYYVSCSPKSVKTAKRVYKKFKHTPNLEIKVVYGDSVGKDMLEYATMLMPLTTDDTSKNEQLRKEVWNLCVEKNLKYSPRLHFEIFGNKRGV